MQKEFMLVKLPESLRGLAREVEKYMTEKYSPLAVIVEYVNNKNMLKEGL
jgi:hypothetical protein